MRRLLTNAAVVLALILCAVIAAVVGWELGRPAQHSRPKVSAAATALHQAATQMSSVTSYRFSGHVTIGIESLQLAGEFSAPDHLHEVLTLPGVAPVERVLIGTTAYQKVGTAWQRVAGTATASDPRSTFSALAGATNVTVSGSVYGFELTGASAAALISGSGPAPTVSGTVTVQAQQIVSVAYQTTSGAATTVSFTYTDLGTTSPVTAPAGVA